jgi:basic membrane protein A
VSGKFRFALVAILAAFALAAVGCGGDESSSSGSGGSSGGSSPAKKALKVGLVTDIGGLNDRSFNALANKGLERAEKELGVQGRVLTSDANSDYVPNLSSLAQQRYDVVIAVGFLMADATATVAKRFPNVKFVIIDSAQADMKGKPTNVEGLLFEEQEAGYLAGYLAGLYAKDHDAGTVSTVGGQKIPPVDHYIAGFQAGAKAANPSVKTLNGYSQSFTDQAACKELALDQIGRGSEVVFQVAGQCGLGAIDAAKQRDVQAIGVDADQAYLGPQVITSATKKIDVAVFNTLKAVQDGTWKGGTDQVFDVKSAGVGIGKLSSAGEKYASQLKSVQSKLAAGSIDVPDTVG